MPAYAQERALTVRRFHEVRGAKLYVESLGSGAPIVFQHGGVVYFESTFAMPPRATMRCGSGAAYEPAVDVKWTSTLTLRLSEVRISAVGFQSI